MKKIILLIIIVIIIIIGVVLKMNKKEKRIENEVVIKHVSMNDIVQIMVENENYIILDARTQAEYNQGHIKGAINIPYDIISKNDFDKDTVIFVYCQSGNRSETAYHTLNSLGYRVYDLGAYEQINLPKE